MPSAPDDAVKYALRLLGYKPRSEKELAERLSRKGFGEEETARAILRMKALGYLDDPSLAEVLKRQAQEGKGLGRAGAKRLMRLRGIPQEMAEEALAGYDEDAAAEKLLRKRSMASIAGQADKDARRKIAARLQRRGFSSGAIKKAIISIKENEDEVS